MMRRSMLLLFVLTVALVAAGVAPAWAQTASVVSSQDYKGFWYKEVTRDKGKPYIQREVLSNAEYLEKKNARIEEMTRIYMALLQGDYETLDEDFDISEERAAEMLEMDPMMAQRIGQDPAYLPQATRIMAEWSMYYEQFDFWDRYVGDVVLRQELTDDEKTSFDPSLLETEVTDILESVQERAEEVSKRQQQAYQLMLTNIKDDVREQEEHDVWLQVQSDSLVDFAEKWGHKFDGSQIRIGPTLYLVRNTQDEQTEDEEEYLPRNAVVVPVPQKKFVTPFDLINDDGTLKMAEGEE